MGTAETNPHDVIKDSLTARNEHRMDLFEYWSVFLGQPYPVNDQLSSEAARRISEAERLFPTIIDQRRKAENDENRVLRTVELVMFVLESCSTAPNRRYFRSAWEKFVPISEVISTRKSVDIVQLEPMDHETLKSLSGELEEIEVMAYLYERITDNVTRAARLQSEYGYSENQRVRQLTSRFGDQGRPEGKVSVPNRSETQLTVPCLRQLKALENKVIGTTTKLRAEEVLRILIAQQEGFELPVTPTKVQDVE